MSNELKTGNCEELDSHALLAHHICDDVGRNEIYLIKNELGHIKMAMWRLNSSRWGIFKIGDAEPFDRDQYRSDLMERNGVRITNQSC